MQKQIHLLKFGSFSVADPSWPYNLHDDSSGPLICNHVIYDHTCLSSHPLITGSPGVLHKVGRFLFFLSLVVLSPPSGGITFSYLEHSSSGSSRER